MKNIKLQYYLRGLGVGMLVTAIIMSVALPGDEKALTDAQIKERALELGMVDGNSFVLSDLQGDQFVKGDSEDEEQLLETEEAELMEGTENVEQTTKVEEAAEGDIAESEQVTEEQPVEEQLKEEQTAVESSDTEDLISQPKVKGEVNPEGNTVTIEISMGANSYSVSKVLAETGLVSDAKAYDSFLCNEGYSKKIHTGKYLIAIGTGEEEIAKIITGKR